MFLPSYPNGGVDGARLTPDQLAESVRQATGLSIVGGFSAMLDSGDAQYSNDRVSGFAAGNDREEWKLALSASKGATWRTAPVPHGIGAKVVFLFAIGFGQGSPLPQPSGSWSLTVNGREAVSVRVVNHSQLWRSLACKFAFSMRRCETAPPYCSMTLSSLVKDESQAAFGVGALLVPADWCQEGEPAVIGVAPLQGRPDSTRWLSINATQGIDGHANILPALEMLSDGWVHRSGAYNLYFGDIHTHSGQIRESSENRGCGWGSWEDNYEYARGPGGLDFFALTDHEYQIEPGWEERYFGLADAYEVPGEFVCLPAYEHTSLVYGHRNVYFKQGGKLVNTNKALGGGPSRTPADNTTPAELWSRLDASGLEYFTVPHHPSSASHPFCWDLFSAEHDRLCEVYSAWGSSEYYGDFPRGVSDRHEGLYAREALGRGLRFGLIASSDGHGGTPGDETSPHPKHPHLFHFCGSGRAVVLASELSRTAVFEALRDRRCYGTTGPPIVLDFTISGAAMGSELPPSRVPPCLRIVCKGSNGIESVRIVRNGRPVHTAYYHGEWEAHLEWVDEGYAPGDAASYYVRVTQVDRESAWSSPIWLG